MSEGPTTEAELAKVLEVSELAVRLLSAAGMPTGSDYGPVFRTAQEAAAFFQVSVTTLANWKGKGCPMGDGYYPVAKMLSWRRRQPEPDVREWWATGNPDLQPRQATGDLARAILRVLRSDLAAVFVELPQNEGEQPGQGYHDAIRRVLLTWLLDDAAIERLLVDTWVTV